MADNKEKPVTMSNAEKKMQTLFSTLHLHELSEKPQTNSLLMKLSAELRNKIYEEVAILEEVALHLSNHLCRFKGCKLAAGIALLSTCKQVQREAYHIVWDNLRFELEISDHLRIVCYEPCKSLGTLSNAPILSKIRNLFIHFEPQNPSTEERIRIEERDDALEEILLKNENIKRLELVTYGWIYMATPGYGDGYWRVNNMIKGLYKMNFGGLITALQEKKIPVTVYNPTTKQMEDSYKLEGEETGNILFW